MIRIFLTLPLSFPSFHNLKSLLGKLFMPFLPKRNTSRIKLFIKSGIRKPNCTVHIVIIIVFTIMQCPPHLTTKKILVAHHYNHFF